MRNDQIFVLLLVVLLPLSGCFDGGGVGEAEGADDSTSTVVQHFYNNTTTIQSTPSYKYVTFDEEISNGNWNSTIVPMKNNFGGEENYEHVHLGWFNTTSNNLYTVVYSTYTCETISGWEAGSECGIYFESTCGDISYPNQVFSLITSETNARMLPGTVDSSCMHNVYSYLPISLVQDYDIMRMHYEIAFKEIPVSAL